MLYSTLSLPRQNISFPLLGKVSMMHNEYFMRNLKGTEMKPTQV